MIAVSPKLGGDRRRMGDRIIHGVKIHGVKAPAILIPEDIVVVEDVKKMAPHSHNQKLFRGREIYQFSLIWLLHQMVTRSSTGLNGRPHITSLFDQKSAAVRNYGALDVPPLENS